MNRDRIMAELPPAMAAWLTAHGSDSTWEQVARDLAVSLGIRLLAGEPANNPLLRTVLRTGTSPIVRVVAIELDDGRPWSIARVAKAVTRYLGLASGRYDVTRRLGRYPREQTAQTDTADSLAA